MICIPLAAGVFAYKMNTMVGAAAMSLSRFTVCMNALRLNFMKIDRGDSVMKKTIQIKGMMCQHCEAHVKEALEKIAGVEEATANHEANLVTLKTSADVAESDLKAAVEAAGYEYVGIK